MPHAYPADDELADVRWFGAEAVAAAVAGATGQEGETERERR